MVSKGNSWCVVKLGDDYNWWVHESSDNIHCDADYAGILDPKQVERVADVLLPLKKYGLSDEILNNAFITYSISKEMPNEMLRIVETKDNILSPRESIFCLPNIFSDREGPFIEFLDHITAIRVNFLNDNLNFHQPLNVEEVEDILHIEQHERYISGTKMHVFDEIMSILDYVPAGYSLDGENDDEDLKQDDDIDLSEFDDEIDESLEMKNEESWR